MGNQPVETCGIVYICALNVMPFRAKKEAGSGERDSKLSLYADLRIGSSRFAIRALRDFPRVQGMGVAPCSDAVFSTDWINRVFVFMVAAHIL